MSSMLPFSKQDLQKDPWSVLSMKIPRRATSDVLYMGYHAAQWCRNNLISRINSAAIRHGYAFDVLKHSDLALHRMRELHELLSHADRVTNKKRKRFFGLF